MRSEASRFLGASLLAMALAAPARAEWMQPDPALREMQMQARLAARDTTGHSQEPARLDSLGALLLKLARLDEAHKVYSRTREVEPSNAEALAALGKIALYRGRLAEAESLLTAAGAEPGALEDLMALHVRQGRYEAAAAIAERLQEDGRLEMLKAMAEGPCYEIASGPAETRVLWKSAYPVPLVRAKINGQSVLMAIDTGASDLLIDVAAMRTCKVQKLLAKRTEFWTGSRVAVQNAMIQRFEIGDFKLQRLPAGALQLRKWSMEINPYSEAVVGVIGLEFLRRFTPTLDFKKHVLELRRPDAAVTAPPGAQKVPFELWGASELTLYGSLNGGRRMAMVMQSGVPGCGVGSTEDVFEEVGVKAGMLSRVAKGAGQWLQGRPWVAVVVPTVTIGPVAEDKVQGWSGALDPAELWRHGVRRDALISGDLLRNWRITIDWGRQQLWIES